MFDYYNYLGFFHPYYFFDKSKKICIYRNYDNAILDLDEKHEFDILAIAEILNKNFILGDRTIISGINRTPWLAKLNKEKIDWEYYNLKKHQELKIEENTIADKLFELLCEEIIFYVTDKNRIGVLLSGGMDSRIVAGVLDYLIKKRLLKAESVTAYTWGNSNSRDVVYAKEISKRLGWNWKHYIVTAENLWENFKTAGLRGSEYSGIHLHAIPQIIKDLEVDVLLAGSFGDSIGRAEYSGKHVLELNSIVRKMGNFAGLLKHKSYKRIKGKWINDLNFYHKQFPEEKKYQQNELDYQLHYMRRMLNPCIELLNDVVPTFQVFTSPNVYQYMWSINPLLRNNNLYSLLMNKFYTKLDDIPWARTGLPYLANTGIPDNYTKTHHMYSQQIQFELFSVIKETLLSNLGLLPNIINKKSVKMLLRLVDNKRYYNFDYLERLTWLISLVFFIKIHQNIKNNKVGDSVIDFFNSYIKLPIEYSLKHFYRKMI